jgi:regulator of RNase E activity RraA
VNRPVDIGGITVEPGEVLHAGKEGVIKIPPGCLAALPERAADMRMIEHLSHIGNRRDDLNAHEERDRTMGLFKKYGFI